MTEPHRKGCFKPDVKTPYVSFSVNFPNSFVSKLHEYFPKITLNDTYAIRDMRQNCFHHPIYGDEKIIADRLKACENQYMLCVIETPFLFKPIDRRVSLLYASFLEP